MTDQRKNGAVSFPPYGFMDNSLLQTLGSKNVVASPTQPRVPPDFRPDLLDHDKRKDAWHEFFHSTLNVLSETLWPVWDENQRAWKGAAQATMLRLTEADLKILVAIRSGDNLPINAQPSSKARAINCPPHLAFFKEEDSSRILYSYAMYDRDLDPKYAAIFSDAWFAGIDAKCSTTQLQFKARLQRPRAYQTAVLLGKTTFTVEEAISNMTPSMVSGHSLQGLIGSGAVMERILESGMDFSSSNWDALTQYAVDIGDRRVMAGIHYPSDNIASWTVLMRLADHIFRAPEVKPRLWDAITKHSLVFQRILDSGDPIYDPGLKLLEQAYGQSGQSTCRVRRKDPKGKAD
jgi:hypothetical protein